MMDTATQTGSPASSHTLLLVASTKDGKDVRLNKEVDVISLEEISPNIPASVEQTLVISTTSTPSAPGVPPPQAAPPTCTATSITLQPSAPPKKVWAFLLHSSTSSSSASASTGPSRNAIPTSSVVGNSIPAASATAQDAVLQVSPSRRSELVRLLTSGPGADHPTATTTDVSYASLTHLLQR